MKVGLKKEILKDISKVFEEIKSLGFIPEYILTLDNINITTIGHPKEILIQT